METVLDDQTFHAKCKTDRETNIKIGRELQTLIESGRWPYALDKFQTEFNCYNQFCDLGPANFSYKVRLAVAAIVVLYGLFIISDTPLFGFLYWVGMIMSGTMYQHRLAKLKDATKLFISHIDRFSRGDLTTTKAASLTNEQHKPALQSKSEEITKLHDLLKAGALTQAEFDSEKKRVLAKAA